MKFPLLLFAILQSTAPVQQTQQAPLVSATIEGFVLRAGTDEPISRARITVLQMTGPGGAPISAGARRIIPVVTTDSQGHFVIGNVDPGSYYVTAQRNGFAQQAYGERAPGRPGAPVNVVAGQTLKDVVFRLSPGGAISGRVADSTGEPIAGMTVELVKSSYDPNGQRTLQVINVGHTDDRGEYRIYWITPGRYYLDVSPRPVGPQYPNFNEVIEPGYVLTYYPGTRDPSMAEVIEVQPGAELSPIDFKLNRQPFFRVRGRVFDVQTGQFPRNANVFLSAKLPTGRSFSFTNRGNYNTADGTFEIRDVPPGSYWVHANMDRNSVQVPIEISASDVENVPLALTSGFQMTGRVLVDGTSSAVLPDIERTEIYLTSIESLPLGEPRGQLKANGLFSFENIPAGEYRITLVPMPANTFMESARLGQTDVSAGLTISGPLSDSLEIALSTKGGLVEGTVLDKEQKPMPGAQVVLISERQRDRRDLFRPSRADQNGHFTMRTIAPGDYKLLAWEDIEPGAYYDPDFIRKYEALGTPVKITESGRLTVETKVLPVN
jgi:hypothetical protein